MSTKPRCIWVGDACVASGFAQSTHHIVDVLSETMEVMVIGINYEGDPHPWNNDLHRVWPAAAGRDWTGAARLWSLADQFGPDVIVIQQDPWNFGMYRSEKGKVPVVGIVAVDGKMCWGTELNGLAHAIFWTRFGMEEAKLGGYTGPASVVPLGVDLDVYRAEPKDVVRKQIGLPKALELRGLPEEVFIVGAVGRNQPRKRLDITIQYFAEWIKSFDVRDAILWLHVAPTGDDAYDLRRLAKYYGITNRVMIPNIAPVHGLSEQEMVTVYSALDVLFSTTQGEGFWLPGFEAMACGCPILVPAWSAVGELMLGSARLIHCSGTAVTPSSGISTIGGVADKADAISALNDIYRSEQMRTDMSAAGTKLVRQGRFRWKNIGDNVRDVLDEVIVQRGVEPAAVAVSV